MTFKITNNPGPKLLSISLEPDMWFEILDHMRDSETRMRYAIDTSNMKKDADFQRRYFYLKSIVSLLETQLTH